MKTKLQVRVPNSLIIELTTLLKGQYSLDKSRLKKLINNHLDIYCYIKIQKKESSGFSYIHRNEFKSISPNTRINYADFNYTNIINNLIDLGYIIVNGSYTFTGNDTHTKSYKVVDSMDFNDTHTINFNESLKNVLNIKSEGDLIKEYPEYKTFIKSLFNITIDLKSYQTYLYSKLGCQLKRDLKRVGYSKEGNRYEYKVDHILDHQTIEEYMFEALKINLGLIWFVVSDMGRVYNNLTNLSSTHIPFLRWGKINNFKYLDAKNCQPLNLCTRISSDEFKLSVEGGRFYDDIIDEYNKLYDKNKSRDQIKEIVYKEVLFDDNNKITKKLSKVLTNLFGDKIVEEINNLKKEEVYTITQKIESEIFIDQFKRFKGLIITRHDGIFVLQEDLNEVYNIIKSGYRKIGLNVEIDIKDSLEYYDSFK